MDFTGISNLHGRMRMQKKLIDWKTGTASGKLFMSIRRENENDNSNKSSRRLAAIVNRMRMGRRLSPDDLAYLRTRNRELYAKAARLEQARQSYERKLKRARTREEARALNMKMSVSFVGAGREAARAGNSPGLGEIKAHAMTWRNEYIAFTGTRRWARLPENNAERAERIRQRYGVRAVFLPDPGNLNQRRFQLELSRGKGVYHHLGSESAQRAAATAGNQRHIATAPDWPAHRPATYTSQARARDNHETRQNNRRRRIIAAIA